MGWGGRDELGLPLRRQQQRGWRRCHRRPVSEVGVPRGVCVCEGEQACKTQARSKDERDVPVHTGDSSMTKR